MKKHVIAGEIPAYETPLAPKASPQLVAFIYLIGRDHLPVGLLEDLMAAATTIAGPVSLPHTELASLADRLARALIYEPQSVQRAEDQAEG